jgi:uncharacterized tellurite resistance protein B-like protein
VYGAAAHTTAKPKSRYVRDMAPLDRTLAICDLLLGAAHADSNFTDRERVTVRELLADLFGSEELPSEVEARIDLFQADKFDVKSAAAAFQSDSVDEKKKLLYLVAAVHEADEELDFAEDDYMRALGKALELPADVLDDLVIEVESEDLADDFQALRKAPPPVPGTGTVDVDMDD